ncbi:ORF6N domain-containing protein [Bacteroides acidifaciens]|uniref:ORF6N domain-containing protein n=1 Tax=Bacteroides acidifaciens TaxID=85831 RepID=UPI002557ED43|nr:ORF6N domain-containing protein [Bacteroides acidifaciens]
MNQLELIQSKIYEIRGQRVMLDRDLAELYQVTTGNLNKAVKRNIKRFPSDFMFQLTKEEFDQLKTNLIFQNGISNWGGTRKLPYAFTEQGLAMLSGILNSDIAIQVNINIMRAFVAVRRMMSNPPVDKNAELREEMKKLKDYIEEVFADQNDINEDTRMQLELINQTLAELQVQKKLSDKPRPKIGFIRYDEDSTEK